MFRCIKKWQVVLIFYTVKNVIAETNTDEAYITDEVVRNITDVNNLMIDLIHNYEKLQSIYKNQGSFEDENSTGIEIEEIIRGKSNKNTDKDKGTTRKPRNSKYVTQMIVYESAETINESKKKVNKNLKNKAIENAVTPNPLVDLVINPEKVETTSLSPSLSVDSLDSYTSHEASYEALFDDQTAQTESQEINIDNNNASQLTEENEIEMFSTSDESQGIFLDIPKESDMILINIPEEKSKRAPNKENKKNENGMTILLSPIMNDDKSEYSSVSSNFDFNIEPKNRFDNDGKIFRTSYFLNVQKVSGKDNDLNVQNGTNKVTGRKWLGNFDEKSLKENPKYMEKEKVAVIIITDDKTEGSQSESEDDKQEMLRTSILRDEYGAACARLVIRKCFKACKKAVKSCSGCKSSFKEHFRSNAKLECLKQFQGHTGVEEVISPSSKGIIKPPTEKGVQGTYKDFTRQGFFETCYPSLQAELPKYNNKFSRLRNTTTGDKHVDKINILRDRYEKKCQKASTKRCRAACMTAFHIACNKYSCSHSRKKAFRRNCKSRCKAVYKSKYSGKSSSDCSDSDSDSSSSSSDSD